MFFPLVVRRALAYKLLLLPVLLGTLVATATTASIVLYMDALRDLGLSHALRNAPPGSLDLRLSAESPSADRATYQVGVERVEIEVARWLPELVGEPVRYARSATFLVSQPGEPPASLSTVPRASFHTLSQAQERLDLRAGRWPGPESEMVAGTLTVEALALEPGAQALDLHVGDTVAFTPFWEERTPRVHVRVTGVARLRDPQDPLWQAAALSRFVAEPTLFNTLPVLVREEVLAEALGPAFPKMDAVYAWRYPARTAVLHVANAQAYLNDLQALEATLALNVPGYRQETALDELLATYDTRLRFIQVPLMVVLLLVTAMVLYAVAFLATLVIERQRGDAALLRSRGADGPRVFYLYAAQALLISGLAAIIGPGLAAAAVSGLGLLPAFAALGNGDPLRVSVTPAAYALSGLGGSLSLAVLLIPAFQVARRNPLEERRLAARPPQMPFLQRYYLDVGLAGAAALFLWQLGQQGSLVAGALSRQRSTDLFLLFVPALFLVAAALLLLRLFPLVLGLAARLLAPGAPSWLALGLWQMGRNPLHASRLVLLLVLAAGLGAFAASFAGTLDRSYQERALYKAGADVRLEGMVPNRSGPTVDPAARLAAVPGVAGVSLAFRDSGGFVSGSSTDRYQLLAVEPERFQAVAWWRDDFAGEPLPALLQDLKTTEEVPWGLSLPPDAERLGVWVRPSEPSPLSILYALVADRHGRYFVLRLGNLEKADWTFLEARVEAQPLSRTAPLVPQPPFRLLSLHVRQSPRPPGMQAGAFFLDSITARPAVGEPQTVHRLNDVAGWGVLNVGAIARGDSLRAVPGAGRDGGPAALFTWGATSGFAQRGIYAGPPEYALPVLVSPSVLRITGQRVGETTVITAGGSRYPARIVGVARHVPTLNPGKGAGFIVANLGDVVRQANLVGGGLGSEVQPNEAWLTLAASSTSRAGVVAELGRAGSGAQVVDEAALLGASRADPLVAAGWGALLFVAYGGVLLLGVVGFVAHAILTVDERRSQFALLRTLGLGRGQLRALVWFEQMVVVAVGVGAGYLLGLRTGALLMPFLDRTEEGITVLPPYALETNWGALVLVYGLMALVFALATAWVVRLYNRLALGHVLRMGEE